MSYRINDRVRIRDWDDMLDEFGTNGRGSINCHGYFTHAMKHLCGREFTIRYAERSSLGWQRFELNPPVPFIISGEMLEYADESADEYGVFSLEEIEQMVLGTS